MKASDLIPIATPAPEDEQYAMQHADVLSICFLVAVVCVIMLSVIVLFKYRKRPATA